MQSARDQEIWSYAHAKGAVIVTKDQEFADKRILASSGPVVVWVRLGNSRNSALIGWLELGFPSVLDAIERGETLIELT